VTQPSARPATSGPGCFPPAEIPVLGFLAKQYGVLVDWHASVPGETWPNRQYAHAATSHGTTNIEVGFYPDDTVFELLTAAGRSCRSTWTGSRRCGRTRSSGSMGVATSTTWTG